MKTSAFTALLCLSLFLNGCSLFGFHRVKRAERTPPQESARITFPDSMEQGVHLDGPAVAILEIALNEFLPPDAKAEARSEQLAKCLSRRDTYDVTVLKENDDLYFVSILPWFSRCGIELETPIMDVGATYAIDGSGRILGEL